MTKIIELAHKLGEEIAKSDEITNLNNAKAAYDASAELQGKLSEYETERKLLAEEFCKPENETDKRAVADLQARIQELTREITSDPTYIAFSEAQKALNSLMAGVNAEIKFCITGERPSDCTHDCSTCGGCSH